MTTVYMYMYVRCDIHVLTVQLSETFTHPTHSTPTEDGAPSTASRPDTKKHLRTPSKSEADTITPQTTQLPTSPQVHVY